MVPENQYTLRLKSNPGLTHSAPQAERKVVPENPSLLRHSVNPGLIQAAPQAESKVVPENPETTKQNNPVPRRWSAASKGGTHFVSPLALWTRPTPQETQGRPQHPGGLEVLSRFSKALLSERRQALCQFPGDRCGECYDKILL